MEMKESLQATLIFAFMLGVVLSSFVAMVPPPYAGNVTNSSLDSHVIKLQNDTNNTINTFFGTNSTLANELNTMQGAQSSNPPDQLIFAFSAISWLAIQAGKVALINAPSLFIETVQIVYDFISYGTSALGPLGLAAAALFTLISSLAVALVGITVFFSIIEKITGKSW